MMRLLHKSLNRKVAVAYASGNFEALHYASCCCARGAHQCTMIIGAGQLPPPQLTFKTKTLVNQSNLPQCLVGTKH